MEALTLSERAARAPARECNRYDRLKADLDRLFADSRRDKREVVRIVREYVEEEELPTLEPILPLLLNLKGKPFTLFEHLPFSPLFFTHCARSVIFKTGRQCGKSTSISASGILQANTIPNFTNLFVTPLYEQARRLSNNSVRPFIDESPMRHLMTGVGIEQSVLQRSFLNKSKLMFSFALMDADRTRGISADRLSIDELQDMDAAHIPIMIETMSHSDWGWLQMTGTPKTLDNTLEEKWIRSSQAEWFIPCTHCTTGGQPTLNIPAREHHLLDMIGPYHDFISEQNPAIICHKCRKPINALYGRWVHRYPERRWTSAGYHIPQLILPLHYARPDKWQVFLSKMQGGTTSPATFFNEVLGESYDKGTKLISLTELQSAACLDYENSGRMPSAKVIEAANDSRYVCRVLAIDWGGGGEDEISFTTMAFLGMRHNGQIEVIWGRRLLTPNDHLREAEQVFAVWQMLRPDVVAHDFTGAGAFREDFMVSAGVPLETIMPVAYVRAASSRIIQHVPATIHLPRDHYRVDKTHTLLLTSQCIRRQMVRFFKWDNKGEEDRGLLFDFMSLIEEKIHGRTAGDVYLIKRGTGPDDFAQAVNIGCLAIWHTQDAWPNFVSGAKWHVKKEQEWATGSRDHGWENDRGDSYFQTP
jgi:hypothetical protein